MHNKYWNDTMRRLAGQKRLRLGLNEDKQTDDESDETPKEVVESMEVSDYMLKLAGAKPVLPGLSEDKKESK